MSDSKTTIKTGLVVEQSGTLTPTAIELAPGGTAGTKTVFQGTQTSNATLSLPSTTDTLVGRQTVDTLINKTIVVDDNTVTVSAVGVIATELNAALAELAAGTSSGDAALQAHIDDPSGAHAASAISVTPSGNLGSNNVQAALVELQGDIDANVIATAAVQTNLTNHINDTTDAHDASAISFIPSGALTALNVQDAVTEVYTATTTNASNLSSHIAETAAHGATGAVVGTTNTQTLLNKSLVAPHLEQQLGIGGFSMDHVATQTNPTSGQVKVYAKNDNKLYVLDSTGNETVVGNANLGVVNQTVINIVTNPRGDTITGTTGWTTGSYSAASRPSGTFTASSGTGTFDISSQSGSLSSNGTTKLRFTKSSGASRQGRAVETVMTVPAGYQASVLSLNVLYSIASGSAFVAGSSASDSSMIFYCGQSSDGGSTYTMLEPSSFKLLSVGNPDTLLGYVQVGPSVTHLKLISYVAETANSTWSVDAEVSISKTSHAYGSIITDFVSVTPPPITGSFSGTLNVGTGTYTVQQKRIGDEAIIKYVVRVGASGTSDASGAYIFSYPTGITPLVATQYEVLGYGDITNVGSANPTNRLIAKSFDAGFILDNSDSTLLSSGGNLFNNANMLTITIRVKVSGWSSGAQLADGYDGRIVQASYTQSIAQSVSTGTIINYDTKISDTTSSVTTGASWNYKVPASGFYKIAASLLFASSSFNNGTSQNLFLYKNGTYFRTIAIYPTQATATSTPNPFGSVIVELNAGDLIDVRCDTNNAAKNTSAASISTIDIEKLSGAAFMSPTASVALRYSNTAGTTIPAAGLTNTPFTTKDYDTHSAWNGTEFTAPVSGLYRVGVHQHYNSGSWTVGLKGAILLRDNVTYSYISVISNSAAYSGELFNSGTDEVYLNQGQKLTITTFTNESTSRTLGTVAGLNFISIVKVGM